MAVERGLRLGDRGAQVAHQVVITMPAYNAAATVARTVADIPRGVADRLILVDDASPDDTAAIARELGLDVHVHSENRGYGANQKTCYTIALRDGADIVVMLHPDYQYEPKAVPLLIAPILAGDADMTFGSRFAGLGDPRAGGMPLHRFVGNRVTTAVENLLLGSRFTEMHSGMRAYTRRCLLSLPFLGYRDDFAFDSQLLIDAVTTGQRVVEVPIPTRYTNESSSIGTMRSLSYVTRSIGFSASRTLHHGRRRHRSPLGRRQSARVPAPYGGSAVDRFCALCANDRPHVVTDAGLECLGCGLARQASAQTSRLGSSEQADPASSVLEWALHRMSGFFLAGGRVLAAGRAGIGIEVAAQPGWPALELVATPAEHGNGSTCADAVLVSSLDDDILSTLGGLSGLRALVAPEGLLAVVAGTPSDSAMAGTEDVSCSLRAASFERALRGAGFWLVDWATMPAPSMRPRPRSGRLGPALALARRADARART